MCLCLPSEYLPKDPQLEDVRLVDAYQQSIWGPRLRRSHIEAAARVQIELESAEEDSAVGSSHMEGMLTDILHRIRRTVVCQGRFERIIGGDRVLKDSILI